MTFAASIANFVKRVMTPYVNTRSSLITPDLSATTSYTLMPIILLSQFLYVCRLIYSRASGLLAVKKIDLHYVLANALRIEVRTIIIERCMQLFINMDCLNMFRLIELIHHQIFEVSQLAPMNR